MLNVEFDYRVYGFFFVNCMRHCSISTYERGPCALDSDVIPREVPRGLMDQAFAILAQSLCGIGGTRLECLPMALLSLSLSQKIYNKFKTTVQPLFVTISKI